MTNPKDVNLRAHIDEARVEDALFLLDLGEHPDRVARRLGMSRDALDKVMQRHPPRNR